MRRVQFDQGSDDWLAWRRGLLTATDAAMLLGVSPYVTPFKGWQRKVGEAAEQEVNSAMLQGQRNEPVARKMFIEEYGIEMNPCCIESKIYNFIGASLDGISNCGRYLLEIKSQRPVDNVPNFHMHQMQHQLLSTDNTAEKCYYVTIWDNKIHTIEVFPDKEWMKNYLPKAREFWSRVVFFDPPAMTNKDYKDMNGKQTWDSYAIEYRKTCEQIKNLEELKENYRKELVNMCGEDSCFGSGIKVLKKLNKGRIDYDSVPELVGIEVEKYRKPSSFSWTIMLDQK